jgi:non-canonical poly(A) RNA polymerase PAPD5/7
VKAVCTASYASKKVDITIQDGKHNGIKCVELVKRYLQAYEPLKYLVMAFKQLIFNSQLNDPYQGGLTSYALILMIVAFLQVAQIDHSTRL